MEEGTLVTGVRRVARKSVPSRGTSTGSRVEVAADCDQLVRLKHSPVLPLGEYDSLPETAYLLGNTANAHRLLDGIKEVEAEIRRRRRPRKKA